MKWNKKSYIIISNLITDYIPNDNASLVKTGTVIAENREAEHFLVLKVENGKFHGYFVKYKS